MTDVKPSGAPHEFMERVNSKLCHLCLMPKDHADHRVWGVWCRVSGGITGNREAWLKDGGNAAVLLAESEARAEARRLNVRATRKRSTARSFGGRPAEFHYEARRYGN